MLPRSFILLQLPPCLLPLPLPPPQRPQQPQEVCIPCMVNFIPNTPLIPITTRATAACSSTCGRASVATAAAAGCSHTIIRCWLHVQQQYGVVDVGPIEAAGQDSRVGQLQAA